MIVVITITVIVSGTILMGKVTPHISCVYYTEV